MKMWSASIAEIRSIDTTMLVSSVGPSGGAVWVSPMSSTTFAAGPPGCFSSTVPSPFALSRLT